jgi:hypothetical protein
MSAARRMALRSAGDATFALIVDPRQRDRMAPVLRLRDILGREIVIELTAEEIRDLKADAAKLLDADQATVARWWRTLGGERQAIS